MFNYGKPVAGFSYNPYPASGANAIPPGSGGNSYGNTFFQNPSRSYTQAPSVTRDYGYGNAVDYSRAYTNPQNAYARISSNVPAGFTSAGTLSSTQSALSGAYGAPNVMSSLANGHYEGYDAAVISAASQYLTQNNGGGMSWVNKPVPPPIVHPEAHFPSKTRRNFNKDPPKPIYCETCKISCAGTVAHREHLNGKAHKKKLALISGANKISLPRAKTTYRCDVCEIMCTGRDTYDAHVRGTKHQKTLQTLKRLGKTIPTTIPTVIPPADELRATGKKPPVLNFEASVPAAPQRKVVGTAANFVAGSMLKTTNNANKIEVTVKNESEVEKDDSEIKPIGEEYVDAKYASDGRLLEYRCRLCNCSFSDPNAKSIHTKGRRHRTSYKQKVDPTLKVEAKASVVRSQAKRAHLFENSVENNPAPTGYFNHLNTNHQWAEFDNSMFSANDKSTDDSHVAVKYNEIQISTKDLIDVDRLVDTVEAALKLVSDKLVSSDFDKPSEVKNEQPIEESKSVPSDEITDRVLKGLMRVGLMANSLLIKDDTEVDVVVLSQKIPTVYALRKLVELFPECIDQSYAEKLTITPFEDQAKIVIKIEGFNHSVNVSLTSSLVRQYEGCVETAAGLPSGVLPLAPMLNALAELRHANWFNNRAAPIAALNTTLVILRDIKKRVITWEPLTIFMLSMLVQNVLESFGYPMTPGDALRRVFEAFSSGILLNKRPILFDPCEKTKVDVFDALTYQQREDITSSAQHALRLIIFDQIDKVLDMNRVNDETVASEKDKKRNLTDMTGSEVEDIKRRKIEPVTPTA